MADDADRVGRSAHTPPGQQDDSYKWMALLTTLDDDQLEALLQGATPVEELAPVAEVVQRLRRSVDAEPVPPMSDVLLAQLSAAPVVPLATRRATKASLVKAAAAAVAAVLAVGGAGAAQNRLPSGLQDVVSSTADLVGIDVPSSAERGSHADDDDDGGQPVDTAGTGNGGEPGYEGTTPGGATPADPGTPGDKEPATPATPPQDPGKGPEGTPRSTVPDPPGNGNGLSGSPDQVTGSGKTK